jgi:hypothetical protein
MTDAFGFLDDDAAGADVDDVFAAAAPAPEPASEGLERLGVGDERPEVAAARKAALTAAERSQKARDALAAAEDAAADAAGRVVVAEAKALGYGEAEKKEDWQLVAVEEEAARMRRAEARAEATLTQRVTQLKAAEQAEADAITALRDAIHTAPHPEPVDEDAAAAEPAPMRYESVHEYVEQWLAPIIRRHVNESQGESVVWCQDWASHDEALDRLEATWRAWEAARVDPSPYAVARCWLDVIDPMLSVLLSGTRGPFSECRAALGHKPDGLRPLLYRSEGTN